MTKIIHGTIEATDGAWVIVRFEGVAGTVRIPAEAIEDPTQTGESQ